MIIAIPMLSWDEHAGPIPLILHQVWVGSDPPPWVREQWAAWDEHMTEHHPDWTVMRWTDLSPQVRVAVRIGEQYGLTRPCVADFIRLQVLNRHGGVYVDTDCIPLRPLTGLTGSRGPWVARPTREANGSPVLGNSQVGGPPRHRFHAEVWARGVDQLARGVRNAHHVAGPRSWRWTARRHPVDEITYEDLMSKGAPGDLLAAFPDQAFVHAPWHVKPQDGTNWIA